MASKGPLHPDTLFSHAQDATYFHLPRVFAPEDNGHLYLPQPLAEPVTDGEGNVVTDHHHHTVYQALWKPSTGISVIDNSVKPLDLVFTKFIAIELLVAIIMIALFGWLGTRIKGGNAPKGKLTNTLEAMLLFIRDEVAEPAIGKHDVNRFMPLLWTMFFFVLGCNLFGMVPWMGSPTGSLAVTGVMALITFGAVLAAGIKEMGFFGFFKAQVPHMDLPGPIAVVLIPLIFVIEIFGLLVKHFVLAVRLLANMLAGHVVLAVIIGFIGATASLNIWYGVAPVSVVGAVILSCLELFVAFLQAYIFVFLSALFIGAAVHPH